MAVLNHTHFQSCFDKWISQQHLDLAELLDQHSSDSKTDQNEKRKLLVEKNIKHFEEYSEKRAVMVPHDAPCFLSPSWCSSFENAFLWIGGCRPSLSVRLVYSVCGLELDDQLSEFLLAAEKKDDLAGISANQLNMINSLHCKTVREEEKMSSKFATLQEDIAELPMNGLVGELREEVKHAIDAQCLSLASIVKEADGLRVSTLKELVGILTPGQGVDLLLATKKLHLSMHEWGERMMHQPSDTISN